MVETRELLLSPTRSLQLYVELQPQLPIRPFIRVIALLITSRVPPCIILSEIPKFIRVDFPEGLIRQI